MSQLLWERRPCKCCIHCGVCIQNKQYNNYVIYYERDIIPSWFVWVWPGKRKRMKGKGNGKGEKPYVHFSRHSDASGVWIRDSQTVADLEGVEPDPVPLWATDRRRHGTADK